MPLTNWTFWHMLLSHTPFVAFTLIYVSLIYYSITKNAAAQKFSLFLLFFTGMVGVAVYLTGIASVDMLEDFPHITEKIISAHASKAVTSFILIEIVSLMAVVAFLFFKKPMLLKNLTKAIYVVGLCTILSLYYTTVSGTKVRHTEIRDINQDLPFPKFNNKFDQ